jgi:hypothetical protein
LDTSSDREVNLLSLYQGDEFTGEGTFSDVDTGETYTLFVDYGDGSPVEHPTIDGNHAFTLDHVYLTPGNFDVHVWVSDGVNEIELDDIPVTIADVAPTLTISGLDAIDEGDTYYLDVTALPDPTGDEPTWLIDWGDGSTPGSDTWHDYSLGESETRGVPGVPGTQYLTLDAARGHRWGGGMARIARGAAPGYPHHIARRRPLVAITAEDGIISREGIGVLRALTVSVGLWFAGGSRGACGRGLDR